VTIGAARRDYEAGDWCAVLARTAVIMPSCSARGRRACWPSNRSGGARRRVLTWWQWTCRGSGISQRSDSLLSPQAMGEFIIAAADAFGLEHRHPGADHRWRRRHDSAAGQRRFHFAAWEQPGLFAAEMRASFRSLR